MIINWYARFVPSALAVYQFYVGSLSLISDDVTDAGTLMSNYVY